MDGPVRKFGQAATAGLWYVVVMQHEHVGSDALAMVGISSRTNDAEAVTTIRDAWHRIGDRADAHTVGQAVCASPPPRSYWADIERHDVRPMSPQVDVERRVGLGSAPDVATTSSEPSTP